MAMVFTDFAFKCRTAAPASLRISEGSKLLGFPCPGQQDARRRDSRHVMQQQELQRLARDLPGRQKDRPPPNRSSFSPSKTGTISAPASTCSNGFRSNEVCMTKDEYTANGSHASTTC